MSVVAWKTWYTNGRAFCSTGSMPEDLPSDGCLGFVLLLDEFTDEVQHRRIMNSCNYYFIQETENGTIYGHNDEDDVAERYPGAIIFRGKWTTEKEMSTVLEKMKIWYGT